MWLDQCRAHGECVIKLTTSYYWIHMNRTPQSRPHYLGGGGQKGSPLSQGQGISPPKSPPADTGRLILGRSPPWGDFCGFG